MDGLHQKSSADHGCPPPICPPDRAAMLAVNAVILAAADPVLCCKLAVTVAPSYHCSDLLLAVHATCCCAWLLRSLESAASGFHCTIHCICTMSAHAMHHCCRNSTWVEHGCHLLLLRHWTDAVQAAAVPSAVLCVAAAAAVFHEMSAAYCRVAKTCDEKAKSSHREVRSQSGLACARVLLYRGFSALLGFPKLEEFNFHILNLFKISPS